MGEIKYQEEGDDYSSLRTLTFRGPPYGIVTDFIIARGWARTRRQAEIVLVYITAGSIALIVALVWFNNANASSQAATNMTPEQAAQLETQLRQ